MLIITQALMISLCPVQSKLLLQWFCHILGEFAFVKFVFLNLYFLFILCLRRLGVELGKVQVYQEANRGEIFGECVVICRDVTVHIYIFFLECVYSN